MRDLSLKKRIQFSSLGDSKEEKLRTLFLILLFFCVIFSYTTIRDAKDGIFITVIGREAFSRAKVFSVPIFIPLLFFYSLFISRVKFQYILPIASFLYAVLGVIFSFLINSKVGLFSSQHRWIWWIFYYFGEAFSPILVSGFWSLANMINPPDAAKKNYGLIVCMSKVAGICSIWGAMRFLSISQWDDMAKAQTLLTVAACPLFLIAPLVYFFFRRIPKEHLHGYEATYQLEKERKKNAGKSRFLGGLKSIFENPYVFGIFAIVILYESAVSFMSVMRVTSASEQSDSFSHLLISLYEVYFLTHLVGFFLSLLGTQTLLSRLGPKKCLLFTPIINSVFIIAYFLYPSFTLFKCAFIVLKTMNYAFNLPVRECLYIPTTNEIRLKSKSWIDTFGSKGGKTIGSGFFKIFQTLPAHATFFATLLSSWFFIALYLGRRYVQAISNNRVIGRR